MRGDEFICKKNGLLRAGDFGGVESTIDVDDGFSFVRESFGLIVSETAAFREAAGNIFVLVELGEILRRGDDGDFPIQAARGFAHRDQFDAIRNGGELAEVVARFVVSGEIEIVPGFVA